MTYPTCEYLCYIRDWLWDPCCIPRDYTFTVRVVDNNGFYSDTECTVSMICP